MLNIEQEKVKKSKLQGYDLHMLAFLNSCFLLSNWNKLYSGMTEQLLSSKLHPTARSPFPLEFYPDDGFNSDAGRNVC